MIGQKYKLINTEPVTMNPKCLTKVIYFIIFAASKFWTRSSIG